MAYKGFLQEKRDNKYNCTTNCGIKHPFSKKKRNACKDTRRCACECEELGIYHPQLVDACIGACNTAEKPEDPQEWMCTELGGDVIWDQLGVEACGFRYSQSSEYRMMQEQKQQAANGKNKLLIGVGVLAVILVVVIALIKK